MSFIWAVYVTYSIYISPQCCFNALALSAKLTLSSFSQCRHVNKDKWVISSTSAGLTTVFPPQQWLSLISWALWRSNRGKWWMLWDLSGQATHRVPRWWSTAAPGSEEQVRSRDCITPKDFFFMHFWHEYYNGVSCRGDIMGRNSDFFFSWTSLYQSF